MSTKSLTRADIDAMDDIDTLKKTCAALLQSRDSAVGHNKALKGQLKADAEIRMRLMPMVATMIEALADRAGLAHLPEIRRMIESTGNQTYIQWSSGVPDLMPLPAGAETAIDPRAGDAEMVLGAPIHEAIVLASDLLPHLKPQHAAVVRSLIETIETELGRAIAEGFKARGIAAPQPAGRDCPPDASEIADRLMDIRDNLNMGMSFLRTDLRAAMYRGILQDMRALVETSFDARETDRTPTAGEGVPAEATF